MANYQVKGKFRLDQGVVTSIGAYGFEYDFILNMDDDGEPDTDDIRMAIANTLDMIPESTDGRPTIVGEAGLRAGYSGDDE